MKKFLNIGLSIFGVLLLLSLFIPEIWADFENADLSDTTQEQLDNLDFSVLDDLVSKQNDTMFGSETFVERLQRVLDGDVGEINSYLDYILHTLFGEFVSIVPMLSTMVVIAILCGLILSIRSRVGEESVGKIVEFVCYGIVVIVISTSIMSIVKNVTDTVANLKSQMDALFPIMLTMLASVGASRSVSIFQPLLSISNNLIVQAFSYFLLPLFSLAFVLCILGHFSDLKLTKFHSLCSSVFKWSAGGLIGLSLGAVAIGGAVAGSFDSVSIKAARFAVKNYVPILGGYLSDGFNLVAASSVLIKNAVGVTGIILAFSGILYPLICIVVFGLGLKFAAGVIETIGGGRIAAFLSDVSRVLGMLTAVLAGVGFLYITNIGILLSTANVF